MACDDVAGMGKIQLHMLLPSNVRIISDINIMIPLNNFEFALNKINNLILISRGELVGQSTLLSIHPTREYSTNVSIHP